MPLLAGLTGRYPDLKFVIKAATASNKESFRITEDHIEKLLAAGVEVSASKVYEAIDAKFKEFGLKIKAKQIALEPDLYVEGEAALEQLRKNLRANQDLQNMIDQVMQNRKSKTAIAEVPPKGSVT